jgi:hypothetical protein
MRRGGEVKSPLTSLQIALNIETGDPPAGWGVRRTMSNKEPQNDEVPNA